MLHCGVDVRFASHDHQNVKMLNSALRFAETLCSFEMILQVFDGMIAIFAVCPELERAERHHDHHDFHHDPAILIDGHLSTLTGPMRSHR